jgi:hypothetical protein
MRISQFGFERCQHVTYFLSIWLSWRAFKSDRTYAWVEDINGGCLESKRVKVSWAGAFFPLGWHLDASMQVKTFRAAMRKLM